MHNRPHTKESKRKMSESRKKLLSSGYISPAKGKPGGFLGKHHSEETLKKMSKVHTGNKYHLGIKCSEKTKQRIGKANTGKHHSEETKKKLSEINTGKHHSEETKRKISKISKGIPHFNQRGEKSSNWRGGISNNPYPREFNKDLKLKIRQRDNHTCCLCGRTEREELEELNRVLAVNHIDFDKNNCREENLNTLCSRCNTKINRERDYWTNYFLTN